MRDESIMKINIFIMLLVLLGQIARGDLDQGLIAYYSFDGEQPGFDCSGQGKDAAVDGTATVASGKRGDGLQLDGRGSLIVESFAGHDWGQELTVSLWFQCAGPQLVEGSLISAGRPEYPSWQIGLVNSSFGVGVGVGLMTKNLVSYSRNFPILPLSADEWYHLVLAYDGTNSVLYWNGTKIDPNVANVGPVKMEDGELAMGEQFDGVIDEIRLYRRVLTDDEIRSLRKDEPLKPVAACLRPAVNTNAVPASGEPVITKADREAARLETIACSTLDQWVDMFRRDEKDALGEIMTRTSRRTMMWDALVQMADPALAVPDAKIAPDAKYPCTDTVMNILKVWKTGERFFALEEVKKLADKKTEWEKKQ